MNTNERLCPFIFSLLRFYMPESSCTIESVDWNVVQVVHWSDSVVESVRAAISSYLSMNCSAKPSLVCQPIWHCIMKVSTDCT